jgi:biopolymer transport protein ExbD
MSGDRNWRKRTSRSEGPDLVPFMNVVVILIPMLLLSVVFLKVGVINVSSPRMAPTNTGTLPEETEQLELTVATSLSGFDISTGSATLAPVEGCPNEGPTVCLVEPGSDVGNQIERVERALERGDMEEVEKRLDELVAAYDFAGLYSELRRLKDDNPDETTVRLTASPEIPYELLIRVMDAVRFKLDEDQYASNEKFWRHLARVEEGSPPEKLFSQPIMAVAQ